MIVEQSKTEWRLRGLRIPNHNVKRHYVLRETTFTGGLYENLRFSLPVMKLCIEGRKEG